MQPSAMRMRRLREKQRQASPASPSPVTPAPASSAAAPSPPHGDATVPPAPAVTPQASPPAHTVERHGPRVTLRETEIVTGPGADSFLGPAAVGADESGKGGTPIVEPAPPAPPQKTSPEEAALIGKAIRGYCHLGWSELEARHSEKLARFVPPQMQGAVHEGGLNMVEKSATALAIKHNVRIPYGDELTVGVGVAVATLGIVGTLKAGASNDNNAKKANAANTEAARAASPSPSPTDAEIVEDDGRDAGVAPSPSQEAADTDGELIDL